MAMLDRMLSIVLENQILFCVKDSKFSWKIKELLKLIEVCMWTLSLLQSENLWNLCKIYLYFTHFTPDLPSHVTPLGT